MPLLALLALAAPAGAAGPIDPYDMGPPDSGPSVSTAITAEAFRAAARDLNAKGLALLRDDRPAEALKVFEQARTLDEGDLEIANNLGFVHLRLGDRGAAEDLLRKVLARDPGRASALDNLAELLADSADPRRLEEAADLLGRLRAIRGDSARVLRRQARVATRRGRFDEARRFYDALLAAAPVDDALALEMGGFLQARGELDAALGWYRRVGARAAERPEAARRISELEIEREARRFGWVRADAEPSEAARRQRESARTALKAGDDAEAIRLLVEVIAQAPYYADAYVDLGDARRAAGDASRAEIAYLRALVIDGSHADAARKLGHLYRAAERWVDAAILWSRALTIRPELTELHLPIARAWQAAGDLPRALRQARLGLAALPEDAPDDALRRLRDELTRALPTPPPETDPPGDDPTDLGVALNRARVLLGQRKPDAALAALRAVPPAERGARVLELEGRIFLATDRIDEAITALDGALRLDPELPGVPMLLGQALLDRGRVGEARVHLTRAADGGDTGAAATLLLLDAEAEAPGWLRDLIALPTLWRLRERAHATTADGAHGRRLDDLRAALDTRVRSALTAYGAAAFALLLIGLLVGRRYWGGDTVAELVERHPEVGPDVQRVLSAIRHEVLKHNTLALGGLAETLARGEDAVQKAAWVRQSLLGPPDDPRPDAAIHRLRAYAEQLRQIGRSRGRRLNLEHRDPALSALLRGFRVIEGAASDLDRTVVRGRAPRRLRRAIARSARALNIVGLGALRALLDRLKVFEVTAAGLRAIFDRTRREPGFAGTPVAPLDLDPGPLPARVEMPRVAFEDILTNLLRNAIQAAAAHAPAEVVIGLAVDEDEDPITGLCSLRFAVLDQAPQTLTTEMLRGHSVEDGLGLTGELVTRFEGALEVEPAAAPWSKAVVLTLPRAEDVADTAQRAAITGLDTLDEEGAWTR